MFETEFAFVRRVFTVSMFGCSLFSEFFFILWMRPSISHRKCWRLRFVHRNRKVYDWSTDFDIVNERTNEKSTETRIVEKWKCFSFAYENWKNPFFPSFFVWPAANGRRTKAIANERGTKLAIQPHNEQIFNDVFRKIDCRFSRRTNRTGNVQNYNSFFGFSHFLFIRTFSNVLNEPKNAPNEQLSAEHAVELLSGANCRLSAMLTCTQNSRWHSIGQSNANSEPKKKNQIENGKCETEMKLS